MREEYGITVKKGAGDESSGYESGRSAELLANQETAQRGLWKEFL